MEKLISGLLSLPENTSTHQPLSVITFLSTSLKRTSPSITITQQKRLCAESNYIRRVAGSDKQPEHSDSCSDSWLFITHTHTHTTENKSKSNRRRIKLLWWNLFQHVLTNEFPWLPYVITRNVHSHYRLFQPFGARTKRSKHDTIHMIFFLDNCCF